MSSRARAVPSMMAAASTAGAGAAAAAAASCGILVATGASVRSQVAVRFWRARLQFAWPEAMLLIASIIAAVEAARVATTAERSGGVDAVPVVDEGGGGGGCCECTTIAAGSCDNGGWDSDGKVSGCGEGSIFAMEVSGSASWELSGGRFCAEPTLVAVW